MTRHDDDYWIGRWNRGEIGFHQEHINPYLTEYWPTLNAVPDSTVLVPLCGKSRDMIWLREQGHTVLGIEFSTLAVDGFFQDNAITPLCHSDKRFTHYRTDNLRILQGDFFDLRKTDVENVRAVYDRAAIVALPPQIRRQYVRHLLHLLPAATQMLLLGFDYPHTEMQGPPYAVSNDEIRALFGQHAQVDLLRQIDVLDDNPRFRERGLSRLQESVLRIILNS